MDTSSRLAKPVKVHAQITDSSVSPIKRYQNIVLGSSSMAFLLRYELTMLLCGGLPGAAGLALRQKLYRGLFGRAGRGTTFGRDLIIRHPRKISLGSNVIIDDYTVLEARGETNTGIVIGDSVMIARNAKLSCKNGNISIGNNVGLGANTIIHAVEQNHVRIGNNVIVGGFSYIGGTRYRFERIDVPIAQQGLDLRGGVTIEDNVWLGAHVSIVDGVTIGHDAIIGTGAVVTKDIPPFAIATGVPARITGMRTANGIEQQTELSNTNGKYVEEQRETL